ncbi:hypothetical protein Q787_06560 [Ornithobacterium rhinotracheale H06-030791]|nr:hypothetical protein Q785_06745 [Ornithobacterium rhinotracheale ORT-UMN 88]KGB66671.1 hypothetical protein Q787_06560 [Ornithobacterium rhinotracheale H06-030791]
MNGGFEPKQMRSLSCDKEGDGKHLLFDVFLTTFGKLIKNL